MFIISTVGAFLQHQPVADSCSPALHAVVVIPVYLDLVTVVGGAILNRCKKITSSETGIGEVSFGEITPAKGAIIA